MLSPAALGITGQMIGELETAYAADWARDSEAWQRAGLYSAIAHMVDPRDGALVVDHGTGLGYQPAMLAALHRNGRYVATERNPYTMAGIPGYWDAKGAPGLFHAVPTSSLLQTADGRLYWGKPPQARLAEIMRGARARLTSHIVLIDDDVRFPRALPALLDGEKTDAAILCNPGGGVIRAREWPYEHGEVPLDVARRRVTEVTDAARLAFVRCAAETLKDGGRAVIADRFVAQGQELSSTEGMRSIVGAAIRAIAGRMGSYTQYWELGDSRIMPQVQSGQVPLSILQDGKGREQEAVVREGMTPCTVMVTLHRNDQRFSEPPLPSPYDPSN